MRNFSSCFRLLNRQWAELLVCLILALAELQASGINQAGVSVVGGGSLTSTNCVTGGGGQTIQTPSANCTVDASGNLVANTVTTGGGAAPALPTGTLSCAFLGNANYIAWCIPTGFNQTSFALDFPNTTPSANQFMLFPAPNGSGVSNLTWTTFVSTNLTDSALLARLASPTFTGSPAAPTQTAGDNTTKLATDAFVTTAVNNAIAGVNPAVAVQAASAAVLPNTPTYSNGVAGVGATLTSSTNSVLVVDDYTPLLNDRILAKNQASAFQNGVYTVTQLGVGGVFPWIATRALDYDQPSDINSTGAVPVVNGTANALTSWLLTSTVNSVGTDALTYSQFSVAPNGSGTGFKVESVTTGAVTVANTQTETNLLSFTVPSNEIGNNQVLHLKQRGTVSTNNNNNLRMRAYAGAIVIADGFFSVAGATVAKLDWSLDLSCIPTATFGTSVTTNCFGQFAVSSRDAGSPSTNIFGNTVSGTTPATVSLATNGTLVVKATAQWTGGTADPADTLTANIFEVYRYN